MKLIVNYSLLDSGREAAYAFKASKCSLVTEYLFDPSQQQLSSGLRELLAVYHCLKENKAYFKTKRNKVIVWMTDSQCSYAFLVKGSR